MEGVLFCCMQHEVGSHQIVGLCRQATHPHKRSPVTIVSWRKESFFDSIVRDQVARSNNRILPALVLDVGGLLLAHRFIMSLLKDSDGTQFSAIGDLPFVALD
mmetsp:Transcript_27420/g.53904  ORF Transcript_27420/g.53904 Transcript_27420/m.53904 type:complete len:103 (-) Transcript_27420:458-766(-)